MFASEKTSIIHRRRSSVVLYSKNLVGLVVTLDGGDAALSGLAESGSDRADDSGCDKC